MDDKTEKKTDKPKNEFLSLLTHQLRAPLGVVKWYSEMLLSGGAGKLNLKQKKYLKEIYHGNERMIRLVNIVSHISHIEADRIAIKSSPTDIAELIKDIIKSFKDEISKKKQKFIFERNIRLPKVFADPELLKIVFQSVISNSLKYSLKGGKIICKLEKNDKNILFSALDNGIGIPEAQQEKIFEKMFRSDNASAFYPQGNGLELCASKAIIEILGGKIWFKSKEGEGTTFFVSLPSA